MTRSLDLKSVRPLLACALVFMAWSVLTLALPAGASAEDEPPAGAPPTPPAPPPPPAPEAPPSDTPETGEPVADTPGTGDPSPEAPPPAPDLPKEAPAARRPIPTEVAQTLFDENVRTCGPMTCAADWRKLSKLILRLANEGAARARKSPEFLLRQWGDAAPKSARLGLRIAVTVRDVPQGYDPWIIPDRSRESGVLQPMTISADTLDDATARLIRKSHTQALKDAAAEFSILKKAGYTGVIELRSSVMVSLMGAPVDPEAEAAKAAGMRPTMTADDKLEAKAQNLMWFARKARDAKDLPRMKNILKEILAMPLNKQTAPARKLFDAYSVAGY